MCYLKGAAKLSLLFSKGSDFQVRGYCDSDYASDQDRSRSITGFVFTVDGNTVSWRSESCCSCNDRGGIYFSV